jgi:hypothetical protein
MSFVNKLASLGCLAFLLTLPGTAPLAAQIGGGSIVGVVTDPSGAPVVGVTVRALNQQTNDGQHVLTNETGYYEFPLLRAGRYHLEAELAGFDKVRGAEFDLNTGTRPRIDLKLTVGSVSETIEVKATAPMINATTTDLGVVMDRTSVEELPLNGRDFQELLSLQAGVENAPSSGAGDRGGVSFHGSSALSTNMMLDGVDMSFGEVNGSAGFRSAGGGSVLINTVSIEALEEFKATGSAFTAEYGRTGGGVVNITTRSGGNKLHGTLFEFFRNDKLDATDWFSNKNALGKPPLRWNQFGGNLGGPIRKDRIFFFANYEGAQVKRVSKVTGNTATPALIDAAPEAIRQTMDFYLPKTFTPTTNQYVGLHTRNDQQVNDENTFLGRSDAVLGKHRLTLRYSYNHQNYKSPTFSPVMPTLYPMRFHNVVLQDNTSVTSTSFNELRIGFNRVDLHRHAVGSDLIPAWVTVSSISASQNSYIHFLSTTYTLADNFTMINGAHSMKTGFEIREVRSVRDQGGPPTYSYNSYADLIANKPLNINLLFGGSKGLRTRNYGFYLQDEWRASRTLQLNLGVRYEYTPPFRGGFNIATSDPYGPFIAAQQPMFRADRNNWAPRTGLIWAPGREQRTVIRTGAAISYLMPQAIHFYDMAFISPALPFNTSFAAADVPAQYLLYPQIAPFALKVQADPSLLPASFRLSRSVADYNRRDTYVGMWNLSVQQKLTAGMALQASYVGQRTVKLISVRPLNLVDPATKARPDPSLGQINVEENAANIAYHSLQLSLNQRVWHGLRYDVYFTWAKSIGYYNPDDTITFSGGSLQDPMDIAGSKGPVRGLPPLRYTSAVSYSIPGGKHFQHRIARGLLNGWTLRTINSWRASLPINVTSGADIVGNGRSAGQRPDPVAGIDPYIREGLTWLNPAAFTTKDSRAEKRFGVLGYNALYGTPAFTLNSALHKTFQVKEGHRITFRLETFNTLNHPLLSNPITNLNDPNFGKIQTASSARNVQLGLKYAF